MHVCALCVHLCMHVCVSLCAGCPVYISRHGGPLATRFIHRKGLAQPPTHALEGGQSGMALALIWSPTLMESL